MDFLLLAQDAEASKVLPLIWEFVNSPLGISLISGVLGWILVRVFKARPSWEKVFNDNKGLLFDAVRHAEGAIPNDTESTGAKRADAALQYILKMDEPLKKTKRYDLKQALDHAHLAAEKKGSIPSGA